VVRKKTLSPVANGETAALKTQKKNEGFTLIEIMVSIAILMILILGVGSMLTTSVRVTSYNEDRHLADTLAHGVMERIIDFAAQGSNNFNSLVENNRQGAIPAQPAIPGVRPAIPAEPPGDRLDNDFDGDGVADWGLGGKNIYVYQMLVDDIPVGGQTGLLKQVTIRIYYAAQNPAQPRVDGRRHRNPGGPMPRRYDSPISEISTLIALP